MEIFCLYGADGKEKISLELKEVLGFPDEINYEGGYGIVCALQIEIGCYQIKCDRHISSTGVLYRFSDKLKECYRNLAGSAEYRLMENDLSLVVIMLPYGHAVVRGRFQEYPDRGNVFKFEMGTDQTCLPAVFQGIDSLKDTYGGMNGVKELKEKKSRRKWFHHRKTNK